MSLVLVSVSVRRTPLLDDLAQVEAVRLLGVLQTLLRRGRGLRAEEAHAGLLALVDPVLPVLVARLRLVLLLLLDRLPVLARLQVVDQIEPVVLVVARVDLEVLLLAAYAVSVVSVRVSASECVRVCVRACV